jgi:hypothetical protein
VRELQAAGCELNLEPNFWRLLYLSSGELPVEAKLAEASGRKAACRGNWCGCSTCPIGVPAGTPAFAIAAANITSASRKRDPTW